MRPACLLLLALVAGCGGNEQDYMPLAKGNHWVYIVSMDADSPFEEVTVAGEAPVGNGSGWLLESGMGSSRMAWQGGRLVAAELAGTLYAPPVPIFAADGTNWSGTVTTAVSTVHATATLRRANEDLKIGGRKYRTVRCTLDLQAPDERLQLATWFFPGMGILQQEQRSGPALTRDRRLEFVSGP